MTSPEPVESREQPREDSLLDQITALTLRLNEARTDADTVRSLAQQQDATIRELKAEVDTLRFQVEEAEIDHCARDRWANEANRIAAERDRARDLAAHLEEQLVAIKGLVMTLAIQVTGHEDVPPWLAQQLREIADE